MSSAAHRARRRSSAQGIELATASDLPEVVALVNAAYRGSGGRLGWTSEAGLVEGQRITLAALREELGSATSPMIGLLREPPRLLACVRVEDARPAQGLPACQIGMLAVLPDGQNAGAGARMLDWAEERGRARGARVARLTVVGARATLIEWYERRGYRRTREREPFPYDDERFGRPCVPGLEFIVLQKELDPGEC